MRVAVRAITVATASLYLSEVASVCPTRLADAPGSNAARAHTGHDAHSSEQELEPREASSGAQREASVDAQPDGVLSARCGCSCSRDESAAAAGGSSGSALLAGATAPTPSLAIERAHPAERRLARAAPRAIDHVPRSALRA